MAHPVTGDNSITLSLLIGADHYWDVVEDKIIRGDGPTAVKSKIGYLLSGPITDTSTTSDGKTVQHILNVMTSHMPVENALERFWSLESMGIVPDAPTEKVTDYLEQYQKNSIEHRDGRYYAKLPWKQDHEALPSNFDITLKRTENTIQRLRRDPEILQKYDEIIRDQERRGFIEKVPTEKELPPLVHYISHHPVKKESSTTPVRIVYDCSCRQSSVLPSLNDCLESTPPVTNDLTSILIRFRLYEVALTTDIEKAFLHVGLHETDRDMTRFLWLENPTDPNSQLTTYRFRSVLFGATCSPFILNATLLKHLQLNKDITASSIIERDIYVDNVISSFPSHSDALQYFHEARNLLSSAGMNLRSWTSNSDALQAEASWEGVLDTEPITKVLGLRWEPSADMLSFARRDFPILTNITKRLILKYSSQIYDPLGLLSPVTVRAKLMLQDLWKQKFDWDVPLPSNVQLMWTDLATDLNTVKSMRFARKFLESGNDNLMLHIFVDASTRSYGAAAYICNNDQSRLVMAKNRVAPLKSLTLSQLELMAAVIGARLANHVRESFPSTAITFWSDSQIVLHWLSTTKTLKRFVARRVIEILEITTPSMWKYCPTQDNPADLLTRGITAQLLNNDLWESGPSWLCDMNLWPTWNYGSLTVQSVLESEATQQQNLPDDQQDQRQSATCEIKSPAEHNILNIIDVERYSNYKFLLHVTAYALRFVTNCRVQKQSRNVDPLSANELREAEKTLLRGCQATAFSDELSNLKSATSQTSRLPLVKQLHLYLDDTGCIRCGGRIHNAHVDDATKFPYLLPKKHHLTRLIVRDAHERHLHSGANATITYIRQKFWIPAIRQAVNSVVRSCVSCRRVNGKPYRAPDPPPLPKVRVEESQPFSVTGIDFTGALLIRQSSGNEGKAYICMFTCATTRAVHL